MTYETIFETEAPGGFGTWLGPPFGFWVRKWEDGWSVTLPHQCDNWTIAEYATKAVAEEQLEAFIAEATAALTALKTAEDAA